MKKFITRKSISYILSITILFVIWHISYKLENHEVIIPSIGSTFSAMAQIITDNDFLNTIIITIIRTIIGFAISLLLGFILGFIAGLNKNFEYFIKPYILIMRSIPIVAIMLIALIWIQSNNVPILVNFLLCFPIIYEGVLTGVKNTDKSILEFAKVHNISKFTILTDIYLPFAFNHAISGIMNTISISFKTTVSSEILSLPKFGIGSSIYTAKIYLNTAEVFAWLIIVIVITTIFDFILNIIKNNISMRNGG